MKKNLLIISCNPDDSERLRLDREIKVIAKPAVKEKFNIELLPAATQSDTRNAMLTHSPSIVHFCGHGEGSLGLLFESSTGDSIKVSTKAITKFFELFAEGLECVILNACLSMQQAKSISRHVRYVIGMNRTITDTAAIQFSEAFYESLAAGKGYEFSFLFAKNSIEWTNDNEHDIPVMFKKRITSEALIRARKKDVTKSDDANQDIHLAAKKSESNAQSYSHPLHEYPRGPRPDSNQISIKLCQTFAELNDNDIAVLKLMREAARFRKEADPDDPRVTILSKTQIGSISVLGAEGFWLSAFEVACNHGPRMLAALILSQPEDLFDDDAQRDRAKLLEYLRNMGKR